MKIKFKTSLAGADFSFSVNQIVEVDDIWAAALISSGLAEGVVPDGKQNSDPTGDGAGHTGRSEGVSAPGRKRSR